MFRDSGWRYPVAVDNQVQLSRGSGWRFI
jgi:hypothetical protein